MINDTPATKTCKDCNTEKPLESFYALSGRPHLKDTYCIECKSKRSRRAIKHPKHQPYDEFEQVVIAELKKHGIICSPGKMYGRNYVDVTCWGGVDIEVKHANYRKGQYLFKPTAQQQKRGYNAHIVMLVCSHPDGVMTFHMFPKDHPIFYKQGRLKTGVQYIPDCNRKYQVIDDGTILTDAIMSDRQNRWDMIEEMRLQIARSLMDIIES